MLKAFAPYIIIVIVLGVVSITAVATQLDELTQEFSWPGMHILTGKGKAPTSETFKLNFLTAAGTWLLVSGIITAIVLRVRPALVLIGWFGTAVTGSDTSTNSLFGGLQVAAAHKSSLSPTLLAAANSSGGVLAKMVSPQNLAIGAAAVGLAGQEGDIFRTVIGWSVLLVLIMAVLVMLQSGPLSFMVP